MDLKIGMPAPDFTLPLATFGTISLSNMRGKPVVLYFYPKDDTPGCTTEACAFRDNLPRFGDYDAAIIGISKDSTESHAAFAKKYELRFHLASDENSNVSESYEVYVNKGVYGFGIERTTFLIDKVGIIRGIWRRVKVEGHAEEVLKAVECLNLGLPIPGQEPPKPVVEKPAPASKPPKPAPVKAEPKKPEPKKAEPKKAEPKKAEKKPAAKPAPKKAEPKKAAPKKAVAKKPAAKPVAKKAAAKPAAKKTAAKPVAKKAAPKKAAKKAAAPKKAVAKKAAPKPAPKKAATKKPAAKKKR